MCEQYVLLTCGADAGLPPNRTDSNVDSGPFTHPDLGCLFKL